MTKGIRIGIKPRGPSAAQRVDCAAKLDEAPIAGAVDDAAMIRGVGGVDWIAPERPKT